MVDFTYDDNPEITGRGVLCSFYIQGLLMVLIGMLDIDGRELMPSLVTILAICAALLCEVISEGSLYVALILHLLLCFHVLASHAVIVWVVDKGNPGGHSQTVDNASRGDDNSGPHPFFPWGKKYHIAQVVGLAVLMISVCSIPAESEQGVIKGFFLGTGLPRKRFLLLSLLPWLVSTLTTSFLHRGISQNRRQCCSLSPRMVDILSLIVWICCLVFVIVLLESTLEGNSHHIHQGAESARKWTFGQILPLVLIITPTSLLVKYLVPWFRHPWFRHGQARAPSPRATPQNSDSEDTDERDQDTLQAVSESVVFTNRANVTETASGISTSTFHGATNVTITGGSFTQHLEGLGVRQQDNTNVV